MIRPWVMVGICALALLVVSACSGSSDTDATDTDPTETDPTETTAGDQAGEIAYETDVDALREIYPLGDLAVDSVRWRYHTDFVAQSQGTGGTRALDDLPAQDAEPILEAVFVFADDAIRESVLAGRTTTVADLPSWYPEDLVAAGEVTIAVAASPIDGLPGEVSAFPDVAPYVVVRYQP